MPPRKAALIRVAKGILMLLLMGTVPKKQTALNTPKRTERAQLAVQVKVLARKKKENDSLDAHKRIRDHIDIAIRRIEDMKDDDEKEKSYNELEQYIIQVTSIIK